MSSPIQNKIGATFIPVSDLERARDWYCEILGLEPDGEIQHGHLYVIPLQGGSGLVLDSQIFSQRSSSTAPLFHFNTDNIEEAYAFLKEKKVEMTTDIQNGHWFNFKDPDGNVLMACKC